MSSRGLRPGVDQRPWPRPPGIWAVCGGQESGTDRPSKGAGESRPQSMDNDMKNAQSSRKGREPISEPPSRSTRSDRPVASASEWKFDHHNLHLGRPHFSKGHQHEAIRSQGLSTP